MTEKTMNGLPLLHVLSMYYGMYSMCLFLMLDNYVHTYLSTYMKCMSLSMGRVTSVSTSKRMEFYGIVKDKKRAKRHQQDLNLRPQRGTDSE